MLDTRQQLWSLSDGGERSLGLACDEDGLFLGRTPLLEKSDGRFVPRAQTELQRILGCGYGFAVALDRVMPGLATVAAALNENDLCRARIAAVQLRIPDLPDLLSRLDMEIEDCFARLDSFAKTTAGGDWDPAKHPRAGAPPNPGWFAPAGSTDSSDESTRPTRVSDSTDGDGRLHLPPGDRNDEIGDLLEWIANAKPEDVQGISSEIDRLFYKVGDFQDGNALHHALATVLAHPDDATRQKVLDDYEPITHRDDPGKGSELITDLALTALLGPALRLPRAASDAAQTAEEAGSAEADGAAAAEEAASEFWKLGWSARGFALHQAMGSNLPWWFRGIDDLREGVATSFKSIDLNAPTYQHPPNLANAINRYVNQLAQFKGANYEGWQVSEDQIQSRVLNLIVPKGSMTSAQKAVIDAATERAKSRSIALYITPF